MDTDCDLSQKRKNLLDDENINDQSSIKKPKIENRINLLDFSDCVLVNIFKYLDTTSLYQLGRTCTRFERLVRDPKFWKYVDARRSPNDKQKIDFVTDNVGSHTRHILLAGDRRSDQIISLAFIARSTVLKNISVLALENQFLDGRMIKLKDFPNTIRELSFKRSYISDYRRFFSMSSEAMSNLKVLILDHCQWVETDMVLSLSKYPNLEILSLYMCKKVGDHNIVYLSIIGRFGFKNLKILDARFTGLGGECINSFYRSKTIQEIYFQSYCATYRAEREKRKKEMQLKKSVDGVSYLSDDEDNNDSCLQTIRRRFGGNNLSSYKIDTLTDKSVYFFTRTESTKTERAERPKSILYKYPYSECTCGYYDKFWSMSSPIEPSTSSATIQNNIKQPRKTNEQQKIVDSIYLLQIDPIAYNRFRKCSEKNIGLPDYLQVESTPETKDRRWIGLRDPKNDYEIALIEHTDYQLDSYAISSHFLDLNSLDFTNPMAVMASLNQDVARRHIHVIRAQGRLNFINPHEEVIFTVDPTDKILSFSTEFLCYCARLLYLIHDEYEINKIRFVIDEAIGTIHSKRSIFSDGKLCKILQTGVKEVSRNISCETRKILRAFLIGVVALEDVEEQYRYTICDLVLRVSEKVTCDCSVILMNCLRKKCNSFRNDTLYDYGIYTNELPNSFADEFWGFIVIGKDTCFYDEKLTCNCSNNCEDPEHIEETIIYDGREPRIRDDPFGVEGFGRKEIPFYDRSRLYKRDEHSPFDGPSVNMCYPFRLYENHMFPHPHPYVPLAYDMPPQNPLRHQAPEAQQQNGANDQHYVQQNQIDEHNVQQNAQQNQNNQHNNQRNRNQNENTGQQQDAQNRQQNNVEARRPEAQDRRRQNNAEDRQNNAEGRQNDAEGRPNDVEGRQNNAEGHHNRDSQSPEVNQEDNAAEPHLPGHRNYHRLNPRYDYAIQIHPPPLPNGERQPEEIVALEGRNNIIIVNEDMGPDNQSVHIRIDQFEVDVVDPRREFMEPEENANNDQNARERNEGNANQNNRNAQNPNPNNRRVNQLIRNINHNDEMLQNEMDLLFGDLDVMVHRNHLGPPENRAERQEDEIDVDDRVPMDDRVPIDLGHEDLDMQRVIDIVREVVVENRADNDHVLPNLPNLGRNIDDLRRYSSDEERDEPAAVRLRRRHANYVEVRPMPPEADDIDPFGLNPFNEVIEIVENPGNGRRFEIPLRKLSLRGFRKITDRSLKCIEHLELDLLDVTKTSVTREGVKAFMLLHPSCRVIHETACLCGPRLHI